MRDAPETIAEDCRPFGLVGADEALLELAIVILEEAPFVRMRIRVGSDLYLRERKQLASRFASGLGNAVSVVHVRTDDPHRHRQIRIRFDQFMQNHACSDRWRLAVFLDVADVIPAIAVDMTEPEPTP